jgi:deoxyribonuclease V
MHVDAPSHWPSTPEEAIDEQERLRHLVRTIGTLGQVRLVAGLDVSYAKASDRLVAAVVVLDARSLLPVEHRLVSGQVTFPYAPGLLAFRELPALAEALRRVEVVPDVLVCDGYGVAHPRRFGLASHIGVLTGLPSIGVAKSPFIGAYDEPAPRRGAHTDLVDDGETIGRVLRTRDGVRPVFVSVGHAVNLDDACALVLRMTPAHRLPEPIRAADHAGRVALAANEEPS